MPNVRTLNKDKYNISKNRFRELYYLCLQYYELQEELKEKRDALKGTQFSGMPSSGIRGNPTENIGIACAEISKKCSAIEQAARQADPELHEYIFFAVTHENITFNYLKMKKDIPCERDRYYSSRRKFYYYLDRNLINGETDSREE